ncbi:hypothetical protein GQR58_003229 [Nymphon striatum]|nr:hypothetical protein GQR58_003229 [Nymphon striatum]
MNRAIRQARYLPDRKLEISLFPFLSIFLCVMGVLSFINVLSSFSTPQKIEMSAQLEQGYKVAYQIFNLPDGIIIVPPTKYLRDLQKALNNDGKATLEDIIFQREQMMRVLQSHTGPINQAASSPEVENILEMLHNIRTVNDLALNANYLYEEFLLFGIYPNGGQAYQKIRDIMTFTQDAASITVGLEPLDSNWTLNLKKTKSQEK